MTKEKAQKIFDRLEPCPFCGKKEEGGHQTLIFSPFPKSISKYQVRCISCGVYMIDDREDKVIANWNTRNGVHPIEKVRKED